MNAHVQPATDPWAHWRAALADRKPVDAPKGEVAFGFYRARDGEAISFDPDGVWRSGERPAPAHDDERLELFARVSMYPVSYEDFAAYCEQGRWPDQVAPVEVPADLPAHERTDAELTAQRAAMAAWVAEIGGKVANQDQANKAGNFADEFAKIEKRAAAAHKAEKEPHLEAGRAVDAAWKPVIARADELKRWAKKLPEAFLIAEKARIRAEEQAAAEARAKAAREAEERCREAERNGAPPPVEDAPPLPTPPQKARAGKVHLRTRTIHEIVDMRAVLEYLARLNDHPAELKDVAQLLVNRMRLAGVEVPGVETKTIEVSA